MISQGASANFTCVVATFVLFPVPKIAVIMDTTQGLDNMMHNNGSKPVQLTELETLKKPLRYEYRFSLLISANITEVACSAPLRYSRLWLTARISISGNATSLSANTALAAGNSIQQHVYESGLIHLTVAAAIILIVLTCLIAVSARQYVKGKVTRDTCCSPICKQTLHTAAYFGKGLKEAESSSERASGRVPRRQQK